MHDPRPALILSALTNKPVQIQTKNKLTNSQIQFLNVVTALSLQSSSKYTDNSISFTPGHLNGGRFSFNVDSCGYICYYLTILLPFCQYASEITLYGQLFGNGHPSVFYIRDVLIPQLSFFSQDYAVSLQINQNSVYMTSKPIKQFKSVAFTKVSQISEIFGVAICQNVPKQLSNRVINGFKAQYQDFDNINITQQYSKSEGQNYAIFACGKSENGAVCGAEFAFCEDFSPEDVGTACAMLLQEEIKNFGCIDSNSQLAVLFAIAISEAAVSVVRIGQIGQQVIETMRIINELIGVQFQIEEFTVKGDHGAVLKGNQVVARGSGVIIGNG